MKKFFVIGVIILGLFSFCQKSNAWELNNEQEGTEQLKPKEKKEQEKKQREKIIEHLIFSQAPGLKSFWDKLKYYRKLRGDFIHGMQPFESFLQEDKFLPKIRKYGWNVGFQGSLACPGIGGEFHHDFGENHYIEWGAGIDYDFRDSGLNFGSTVCYKIIW